MKSLTVNLNITMVRTLVNELKAFFTKPAKVVKVKRLNTMSKSHPLCLCRNKRQLIASD